MRRTDAGTEVDFVKQTLFVLFFLGFATMAVAAPFADVPANHWALKSIQRCVDEGILQAPEGVFGGKKLVNRYQVAQMVAMILEKVVVEKAAVSSETLQQIQAMSVEFADELAGMTDKLETLEAGMAELAEELAGMKSAPVTAKGGDCGLKAFASFAIVSRDDEAGRTPYAGRLDSMFFSMPLVALAYEKKIGENTTFVLRMNHESDMGNASDAQIDRVYFGVKDLFDGIDARLGAINPLFSLEQDGAFETSDRTITPSFLNNAWRQLRVSGVELEKAMGARETAVTLGLFSAGDTAPAFFFGPAGATISELHHGSIEGITELDSELGYYLKIDPKGCKNFDWNLVYYSTNGDPLGTTPSDDLQVLQFGFEWTQSKDFTVLGQYADASMNSAGAPNLDADTTDWFLLLNYALDAKQSISFRYESYSYNSGALAAVDQDFDAMTLAWNRKLNDSAMLQFEWLSVDDDTSIAATDADDDVIQLQYKIWF